ncbi:uncharacterized protein LOC129591144 isoform X2 [Paramacrobiotus metropolitanus]|nr:uncharacterized protein LOC129591144 isoform X2 [Paramacrobiotus metropolitanus]
MADRGFRILEDQDPYSDDYFVALLILHKLSGTRYKRVEKRLTKVMLHKKYELRDVKGRSKFLPGSGLPDVCVILGCHYEKSLKKAVQGITALLSGPEAWREHTVIEGFSKTRISTEHGITRKFMTETIREWDKLRNRDLWLETDVDTRAGKAGSSNFEMRTTGMNSSQVLDSSGEVLSGSQVHERNRDKRSRSRTPNPRSSKDEK